MLNYIIVQAGGKGTRMEALTRNKPKALVPVNNLPMIMHLFRKYPDKRFIIIGDYKYEVLESYLREFANVDYKMICATGKSGTCSGLKEAVELIPEQQRFMLIWCDLVLPDDYELPETSNNVMLIDPRGYFGNTEIYGDVAYDWVKLYYSLYSNYDQFNLKRFNLYINKRDVMLEITSNKWEKLEDDFFDFVGDEITPKQMKLLLAITWLSLTTYAWEDYDSICGAFYNGLYYLEEAL